MTARAMVLCAGLGTRLRPLTDELPKPLVPVGDRPLLAHIARALAAAGLRRLVLNTHHLPDVFLNDLKRLELEVQVFHEPEILGTAGGVAAARAALGPPPVLVWNGDILCEPPLGELLSFAGDGLCLAVAPRAVGSGTVGLGRDGNVVRLRGERFGEEIGGGDYIGVAALGARCLATLPERGCLIGDWALPEARRGGAIAVVEHAAGWTDAGDLAAYLAANRRFLEDRAWDDSWVGEGARIDPGVELSRSVVGAGARLEGCGPVRGSVIWPGARARAPLIDAVVTRSGRVVTLSE